MSSPVCVEVSWAHLSRGGLSYRGPRRLDEAVDDTRRRRPRVSLTRSSRRAGLARQYLSVLEAEQKEMHVSRLSDDSNMLQLAGLAASTLSGRFESKDDLCLGERARSNKEKPQ